MTEGSFAQTLVESALAAGAQSAQADHTAYDYFEIDADTRAVTLVRSAKGDDTTVTVVRDDRKGSAKFSGRKGDDANTAISQALAAAQAGRADPAHRLAKGDVAEVSRHGDDIANREDMVEAAREHIAYMAERYPQILTRHCIYAFTDQRRSFCSSAGIARQERRGFYSLGVLFAAKDGEKTSSFKHTGAASFTPFAPLRAAGSVQRSIEDALLALDPKPAPGKFTGDVILTPDGLWGLIDSIANALSGYALLAGTTPYMDRRGDLIASPKLSLLNRPRSPDLPAGADFDSFGVATQDRDLIRDGRLVDFLVDFYIANKLEREQTGGRTNLVIPPGTSRLDDLISETEEGILLSRFSGGRPNDKLDFSGIAKNSFYIKDGKIRHALTETMVSGNLQDLLLNVRDLSREYVNFGDRSFPYVAASGVTISSH